MVKREIGEQWNDDAKADDIGERGKKNRQHDVWGYKPERARSSALSAPPEQALDIGELQFHISGAAVVALA